MPHVLALGDWGRDLGLLVPLYRDGFELTMTCGVPTDHLGPGGVGQWRGVPLVAFGNRDDDEDLLAEMGRLKMPWVAWNRRDDPVTALAAYHAGASVVLPGSAPPDLIRAAITRAASATPGGRPPCVAEIRAVRRGEPITLAQETVLEVRDGVVAQSVVHADGVSVLLGLAGPGGLLVAHPPDACGIVLVAHTDARLALRPWSLAVGDPAFPDRLLDRLRQMEAWAAMQARPAFDQRLLGIVSLLAEQFGRPVGAGDASGTVVDVRVTHAQLASAIGSTRTTVTRLLGDLRRIRALATIGRGASERLVLPGPPPVGHARHVTGR